MKVNFVQHMRDTFFFAKTLFNSEDSRHRADRYEALFGIPYGVG